MQRTICEKMLSWYDENKRILPFRGSRDPYRVWVSEIMLQQTRTETVGAYFTRFISRFPDVFALAAANEEDVLKLWEGLGYYSRARNLLKAAKMIVRDRGGVFPSDVPSLRALPGVGDYTAAAVASIAFDAPYPAMDGNLTRVFSRLFDIRQDVGIPSVRRMLYEKALEEMPRERSGDFNQALMDLGATICLPGTPDCEKCPLIRLCGAYAAGDADLLPVKSAAAPPKEIPLAVVIVTCKGRALMMKREESLLKNLWVFPLLEDATTKTAVQKGLQKLGVHAAFKSGLGSARHVFTHRVWQMTLFHYAAEKAQSKAGEWLTLAQIRKRPLPTAMRAARAEAERLLAPRFLEMNEQNLPQLSAVYAQSWQFSHQSHCSPAFLAQHTPEYMEMILRGQSGAGKKVFCLAVAEETAGVLVLDEEKNELVTLYIAPDFQRIGLGRQAVAFAVSALDAKRAMRVAVMEDNAPAVHLYRAYGFSQVLEKKVLDAAYGIVEMTLVRAPQESI